ncbi:hypothetical protein pb186bvf_004752 [Paramecium bursaria]
MQGTTVELGRIFLIIGSFEICGIEVSDYNQKFLFKEIFRQNEFLGVVLYLIVCLDYEGKLFIKHLGKKSLIILKHYYDGLTKQYS